MSAVREESAGDEERHEFRCSKVGMLAWFLVLFVLQWRLIDMFVLRMEDVEPSQNSHYIHKVRP